MILTCPNCSAKYNVPNLVIQPSGKKVRCSKCKHEWVQMPIDYQPYATAGDLHFDGVAPKFLSEANLPKVIKPLPFWIYPAASVPLLLLLLVLIAFTQRDSLKHSFPEIYKSYDIYNTKGLALADITVQSITSRNLETKIDIKGSIINETDKAISTPLLRFIVNDDKGQPIASQSEMPKQVEIKSGEMIDFSVSLSAKQDQTPTNIIIDLGSPVEVSYR